MSFFNFPETLIFFSISFVKKKKKKTDARIPETNLSTTHPQFIFFLFLGVCHCDELGYLFKVNLMDYVPEKESKEDKMLETMTKLWTNFAKFNDPTPKSEIAEWKPVDSNNKYYLDIGDSLVLKSDLCHSEIQFWKDIFRFISNRQD